MSSSISRRIAKLEAAAGLLQGDFATRCRRHAEELLALDEEQPTKELISSMAEGIQRQGGPCDHETSLLALE